MDTKTFVSGLLAGSLFGIAVGIVLASSTSGETKEKLIKGAKKITDSLGDTVNETIEGVKEQFNEGVERAAGKGKEAIKTYGERAKL